MRTQKISGQRTAAFSDGVIAVVITLMVLELKAPEAATFSALLPLWPTAVSYAVSYLFIAIIWMNHHHLLRFVHSATPRLIWINFAHLFAISLIPFATAWVARTRLQAAPVTLYAAMFVIVNIAYRLFESEVLKQATPSQMCQRMQRMARRRSLVTILIFATAALVSATAPLAGFGLICIALFSYLRPEAPGSSRWPTRKHAMTLLKQL